MREYDQEMMTNLVFLPVVVDNGPFFADVEILFLAVETVEVDDTDDDGRGGGVGAGGGTVGWFVAEVFLGG